MKTDLEPNNLVERRAYYGVKILQLNLETRMSELIPVDVYKKELLKVSQIITTHLRKLPGILKRKANLNQKQAGLVKSLVCGMSMNVGHKILDDE